MYGYKKSYEELLSESGLDTLQTRRERVVAKFAVKTQKNPVYSHWFPPNPNQTSVRKPKQYREDFARTTRLYNSPLYHTRRLLNNSPNDPQPEPQSYDLAYLFDDL